MSDYLKNHRRELCPKCEPRSFAYSIVKTCGYCSNCDREWFYRYINIEDNIKKARRYWFYGDNRKEKFKVK